MTRKPWSKREDDYLKSFFTGCGIPPDMLARDLERTESSVRARIRRLGLKPPAEGMTFGPSLRIPFQRKGSCK